ncbi:MAG TPA: hypothetical protein VG223_18545 [Solirubrobacteraceae bacterium]|jgi:hypothetical protein|nr:hypothetical protein [Solirubrobacteraceae bacterium]
MRTATNADTWLGWSMIDQLLECYVSWREECDGVRLAYERWNEAARGERRLAHAVYLAALDREERGARAYAEQIERVSRISPGVTTFDRPLLPAIPQPRW